MSLSVEPELVRSELGLRRWRAAEASAGSSDEPIYGAVLRLIRLMDLGGDVLDFGSGTGTLTSRMAALRKFSSVTGIDLMSRPPTITEEVKWLSRDLNEPLDLSPESFDTVIAAEIIEHLENPRSLAREWFGILRPGGTLILSTPNNESWRSLLSLAIRGHFAAFADESYPAHITALVRKDIWRMLSEAGFTAVAFSYTGAGAIPRMTHVTWQAISFGVLKGVRYSDNVLAVARKPACHPSVVAG